MNKGIWKKSMVCTLALCSALMCVGCRADGPVPSKHAVKRYVAELCDESVKIIDTENISDKIGIVAFNIEGVPYTEVASALANTAGIDVGKGTFGSQPYVYRLLGIPNSDDVEEEESADMPGMVRISMGIYNTEEEIDILLDTVRNIAEK